MLKKPAAASMRALRCRRGAALIEYVLLAGLIALVGIASVTTFGTNLKAQYTAVSTTV